MESQVFWQAEARYHFHPDVWIEVDIDELTIWIVKVGHRKNVYR